MTFWVYILQSETSGRFYIGQTDNLNRRLCDHNDPKYNSTKTTKRFQGPWKLVYSEKLETRSEAMSRERQIKSWKSRKALSELIVSGSGC